MHFTSNELPVLFVVFFTRKGARDAKVSHFLVKAVIIKRRNEEHAGDHLARVTRVNTRKLHWREEVLLFKRELNYAGQKDYTLKKGQVNSDLALVKGNMMYLHACGNRNGGC